VHGADFVVDHGYAVAQASLGGGDISVFVVDESLALAARSQSQYQYRQNAKQQNSIGMGKEEFHRTADHYKPMAEGVAWEDSGERDSRQQIAGHSLGPSIIDFSGVGRLATKQL
jgi:hypothetical protein